MKKASLLRLGILSIIIIATIFQLNSGFRSIFLNGITLLMGSLLLLWLVSLVMKDASIIDIFWGFGHLSLAWAYAYWNDWSSITFRQQIFLGIVTLWGLRLTIYLAMRNLGKGEDYRYAQWRQEEGKKWWWLSFFRVFALQGFLIWLIASFFAPTMEATPDELQIWDVLGIILWIIGFGFEAIGDFQLRKFKSNPANKGKVMDKGLWRYTRHPNYFGDALLWWGFFCFALAHPKGWYFIYGPIIMTFFLMRVSGVTLLEQKLKKSKPKYREYMERTSAFFPMPPKR